MAWNKEGLCYFFAELSYGIEHHKGEYDSIDEFVSFMMLDILTSLFAQAPTNESKLRFIDNVNQTIEAIKINFDKGEKNVEQV